MEVLSDSGIKRRKVDHNDNLFVDALDRYQNGGNKPTESNTTNNRKRENIRDHGITRCFEDVLNGNVQYPPFKSPYSESVLKNFIWRDFSARPPKLKLLQQIQATQNLYVLIFHFDSCINWQQE